MSSQFKKALTLSAVAMLLALLGCGGAEPPAETPAAEGAAESPTASPSEPESEPEPEPEPGMESEPAAAATSEPEPEPEAEPGPPSAVVSAELTIPIVAGDGTHKAVVAKVLGEIVAEQRRTDYSNVTVLGKTTLSWVAGATRITLINFPDVSALQEASTEEGGWDGALIVQDPGESYTLHQEALKAAADAGAKKAVLFINVSDRLTDMEVYDLEAQSLPGWLESFGYAGEGMPVITAHSDKAAAGDAGERAAFEKLLASVEQHLAGIQ
jgi:hypothetical protein